MKTIKVSEATPLQLNYLVAKCEGMPDTEYLRSHLDAWPYSTDWSRGGPIIERADINVTRHTHSEITESRQEIYRKDGWTAFSTPTAYWMRPTRAYGPTPLIAAMRAYVASKLGDEVEAPDELAAA